MIAGINAARLALGEEVITVPIETALGSMARYITEADPNNFQPMNVNFGLFPDLSRRYRSKEERGKKQAERALATIQNFMNSVSI